MTMLKSFLLSLFVAAPVSVLPILDTTTRLDMVDYYEAGMHVPVKNRYGGDSGMLLLTDTLVSVQLTEGSKLEMRLTPDSNVVVKRTYKLPEGDVVSEKRYNKSWERVE